MENIKILTKRAEESEKAGKTALDELKIICDARDIETKAFLQLDETMRKLADEYNTGNYTDETVKDILFSFAILETLHFEIMDLELAENESEREAATQKLKEFFEEEDTTAADIITDEWEVNLH